MPRLQTRTITVKTGFMPWLKDDPGVISIVENFSWAWSISQSSFLANLIKCCIVHCWLLAPRIVVPVCVKNHVIKIEMFFIDILYIINTWSFIWIEINAFQQLKTCSTSHILEFKNFWISFWKVSQSDVKICIFLVVDKETRFKFQTFHSPNNAKALSRYNKYMYA